jgi:hypothetical protein
MGRKPEQQEGRIGIEVVGLMVHNSNGLLTVSASSSVLACPVALGGHRG